MTEHLIKCVPEVIRTRLASVFRLEAVVENTLWLFVDRIFRMGVGLIVWIWLARYLGPEQFGIYNYAIAFVALFGTLAGLGLDSIAVRDLVSRPESRDELLGTTFTLKLVGGLLTLLVTFAVISFTRPDDVLTRWLVAITASGLVFQAFDAVDLWFQSKVNSKYAVYARDGAFVVITCIKIILILIQAPLIAFAWAGLGEMVFCALGLVWAYRANGLFITAWRWSFSRAKELLYDSWPLILSGLVIMIYMRIDQIMLGEMIGAEAVGVYSAAVKLSEGGYFVPIAIISSLFPSIVEAKKISEGLYYERLQSLFNLMSLLAYGLAIPMTVLSGWLVKALFGEAYREAGPVLAIHIWAALFVFLGLARGSWTTNEGLMKFTFATTAIGAMANVLLNLLLIPQYGMIGAAISTLIAQCVASYLSNLFYRKTRLIFIRQSEAIFLVNVFRRPQLRL